MTKQEFIDNVTKKVEKLEISKAAVRVVMDTIFEELTKVVKKEKKFIVPSFGTFSVRARKAKTGRNPKTGEPIKIKASKTVGFKPAPAFKDSL